MIEKEKARSILGLDINAPVVLFFGLIRKYKGVGLLIEAIAQLKNKIPDLRVLIVGEPYIPIRPYLKQTKELGVEEIISFHTSYVEDKDVGVWFSALHSWHLRYLLLVRLTHIPTCSLLFYCSHTRF